MYSIAAFCPAVKRKQHKKTQKTGPQAAPVWEGLRAGSLCRRVLLFFVLLFPLDYHLAAVAEHHGQPSVPVYFQAIHGDVSNVLFELSYKFGVPGEGIKNHNKQRKQKREK